MKHYKVMHKGILFGKYRIGLLKEWANCSVCNIYFPASKYIVIIGALHMLVMFTS